MCTGIIQPRQFNPKIFKTLIIYFLSFETNLFNITHPNYSIKQLFSQLKYYLPDATYSWRQLRAELLVRVSRLRRD
jgi:hypothetical protein